MGTYDRISVALGTLTPTKTTTATKLSYEKDDRKAILRSATNRRCQVLKRLPEFSLRIKIFL